MRRLRGLDGRVRVWSFPALTPVWQAAGEVSVWSLAFSPDGSVLACGGPSGAVRLRSTANGTERRALTAGEGPVNALAHSSDARHLAASSGASTRVFDPVSGAALGVLTGHAGTVFGLLSRRPPSRLGERRRLRAPVEYLGRRSAQRCAVAE